MSNDYQRGIVNQLKINDNISYQEILNIVYAFQIVSGQTFTIDSTKEILDT